GRRGGRDTPAPAFRGGFRGPVRAPGESPTEIGLPKSPGGWSFKKLNRRAQDWAIVGVAAVKNNGNTGIALVNMGSTPLRATGVEQALASGASPADAAAHAADGLDPPADLNASVEYRKHLATVLVRRALEEAAG